MKKRLLKKEIEKQKGQTYKIRLTFLLLAMKIIFILQQKLLPLQ